MRMAPSFNDIESAYCQEVPNTQDADMLSSSEKAAGAFGTLVIALPSSHMSREVEVNFGGQQRIPGTARTSDSNYIHLA